MIAAFKHSPTHTQVTFRFPVQREYLNPGGTLHGAAQSLFFDVCTTWLLGPIARKPDYWCSFGTSRSLNVVYLRPARKGDVLTLECEVSCGFVLLGLDLDDLLVYASLTKDVRMSRQSMLVSVWLC